MGERILDPNYWGKRLREAPQLHQSVFRCPLDRWLRIEDKHRQILARIVKPGEAILDVGCGYGRLLTLLPLEWLMYSGNPTGDYLGVDLSPDFIDLARKTYPGRSFVCASILDCQEARFTANAQRFDWAVMISLRPMLRRNLGGEAWDVVESRVREFADKLLYLEYDETCEGFIE